MSARVRGALALAFVATLVFGLLRFDGPTEGYWDTYITVPALVMTGHEIDFVLKDGSPTWEMSLQGTLPGDLVDRDGFGIATKDQRIGAPVIAAPMVAGFGLFGLRLLFALCVAMIIPATMLAVRGFPIDAQRRDAIGLLAGVALAWNPYVVSVDRLNANVLILAPCLVLVHLLTRPRRSYVAAGLLFGVIAGIRNEAVCFVPAVSLLAVLGGERPLGRRLGDLVVVGACTVVAMLPVFYWKWFAFGHPLMHPSQYAHFHGFRPEFQHSLFGWEFSFNGLFNWPLHSELVRTPHFAFPTWLLFPLVTLRSTGLLLSALTVGGLLALIERRAALAAALLLWMAPVYVLFGPQENWEEVKMTFMLLAWVPLPLLLAVGLDALAARPKPAAVGTVVLSVLLFGIVQGLGTVRAPADERWYVRFPNASLTTNPGAREGLPEDERNDWTYFQSYETEDEIARERRKLLRVWPWPAQYLPIDAAPGRALAEMGEQLGQRDLTVLEIWGYIYGSRR